MLGLKKPLDKLSDEELMELITEKSQKAFSVLYDRYAERLINYFFGMLWKDREKARDFTQELFTKIVHKPELFNPERSFKTWVFSVANNMCKNEYRKHEVRRNTAHELDRDVMGESGAETTNALDKNAFNEMLDEALSGLDEVKRSTFVMRYRQEMSIKEISEIMGCSEGTVKSRLFYTLKGLHGKLKVFENVRFDD